MGNDAEVRPFVRVCYSNYSAYFSWTIYIIEGALLAFGAFLAWETRHVSKKKVKSIVLVKCLLLFGRYLWRYRWCKQKLSKYKTLKYSFQFSHTDILIKKEIVTVMSLYVLF